MATAASTAAPRPAVLHDIDWDTYTRLLRAFEGQRGFRLTYDQGTIEIMSPRWDHERPADLLGSFVVVLTEELELPRIAGRSVTLRRRKKQRGLEADNCYWIASAGRLHGKTKLDLRVDPPPDLAIEIEVTKRVLNRLAIYAALRVPEVWVVGRKGIRFHVLENNAYASRPESQAFPKLRPTDLARFLRLVGQADDLTIVKQFREWVRKGLRKR
jgi:Uma2 family endonuclease